MKNFSLFIVLFSFTFFYTSAQYSSGVFVAPQFDVGISALDLQKWIPNDEETLIVSGKVKNYGVQPISSFWVSYQIDGGEIFTYKVTGFLIVQNSEHPFSHPDPVRSVLGKNNLKIWTSLPNEEEDENNKNDTLNFSYTIYNIFTGRPRTIMLEGFTASTCGPCVSGNVNLKKVLEENGGRYSLIKYHMDFPGLGDPYYTLESKTRASIYNVFSIPAIHVGGSAYKTATHQLKNATLLELQSEPSFMEVDIDYYIEGKTVYAKAKVIPTEAILDGNAKLFMAILEKKTYNNIGSNEETEFDNVMKKFMPDVNGIALDNASVNTPFIALQNWEFKGNYRLPANAGSPINHNIEHSIEDFNNLIVVAWVQNMQNKTIYQAANGIKTLGPTVVFSSLPVAGGIVTATLNGTTITSETIINGGEILVFTTEAHEGYEFIEWRYNGTVVSTEKNPITVTSDGNYADVTAIFQKKHAQVNEQSHPNFIVYPNPFTNSFTITTVENVRKITITNIFGQLVQEKNFIGTNTITINTKELVRGIYIVSLWTFEGEKIVRKIIKQ